MFISLWIIKGQDLRSHNGYYMLLWCDISISTVHGEPGTRELTCTCHRYFQHLPHPSPASWCQLWSRFSAKGQVNSMLIGDLRKTMSNNYWHSKFYSLPWDTKIQIFNVMFVCWSFSRINIRMATYRDWVLHGLYLLNKGIDLTGKIRDHGLQVCMKNKTIIHSNQRSHSLSAKGKLNTFIQFFSNLFTPLKNLFCKRRKIWRMRILVQMQVQLHWHH